MKINKEKNMLVHYFITFSTKQFLVLRRLALFKGDLSEHDKRNVTASFQHLQLQLCFD